MIEVIFRVDSTNATGGGHLSRCLSLAEACVQLGMKVKFICSFESASMATRMLGPHGFSVGLLPELPTEFKVLGAREINSFVYQSWDAQCVIEAIGKRTSKVRCLVLDSYYLDNTFESNLRPYFDSICVIEDMQDKIHDCDILVDQNWQSVETGDYGRRLPASCSLLLGPDFALLSKSALAIGRKIQETSKVNNILVYFGESDIHNQTEMALMSLDSSHFAGKRVNVVLGGLNNNGAATTEKFSDSRHIEICWFPSGPGFFQLMSGSDLAIGAGGTTMWERMFIGLPALVISTAENQLRSCAGAHREGLHRYLGSWLEVDYSMLRASVLGAIGEPELLISMSRRGQGVIDGRGAHRVASQLAEMSPR